MTYNIFNQIYINNIPPPIKHFFSDVYYLFCLHKDPTDASKLCPLGIPTAMWRIIARHVAQYFKPKFAEYLLPYNFAVGIPQGSATVINAIQFAIEKYISNNENGFAQAFGGPVVHVNTGGMPPQTPPLLVTSGAIPPFFVFFKNSFLANERENIFGGLTVKV